MRYGIVVDVITEIGLKRTRKYIYHYSYKGA